jgi:hypothetical protein
MKNSSLNKHQINKHTIALITFLTLPQLVYFIPDFIDQFLPGVK